MEIVVLYSSRKLIEFISFDQLMDIKFQEFYFIFLLSRVKFQFHSILINIQLFITTILPKGKCINFIVKIVIYDSRKRKIFKWMIENVISLEKC